MLNHILDLNYVQMAEFTHLRERSKDKFFYRLLKWANYNSSTLEFLLNVTGLQSANESSKEVVDLTPDDSNHIRKRARSPLSTNAIHNNNDDNNKSMKDSTRHKNKDRRPKGELTDQHTGSSSSSPRV